MQHFASPIRTRFVVLFSSQFPFCTKQHGYFVRVLLASAGKTAFDFTTAFPWSRNTRKELSCGFWVSWLFRSFELNLMLKITRVCRNPLTCYLSLDTSSFSELSEMRTVLACSNHDSIQNCYPFLLPFYCQYISLQTYIN